MNKLDNFENKLFGVLHNYSPDPPEDSWNIIKSKLPSKRRHRIPVFVFILGFSSLAVIVGITNYSLAQLNKKSNENQLVQNPQVISDNPSKLDLNSSILASCQNQSQTNISEIIDFKSSSRSNKQNYYRNSQIVTKDISNLSTSSKNSEYHSDTNLNNDLLCSETNRIEQRIQILDYFPKQAILPNVQNSLKPNVNKSNSLWMLGINMSELFVLHDKSLNTNDPFYFPESNNKIQKVSNLGISVSWQPLRNWRFSSGVQYQQITKVTEHNANLRLIDGILINPSDPNNKIYEFNYYLYSGQSRSSVNLRMSQEVNNVTMLSDEYFQLGMQIKYKYSSFQIPLSVQYYLHNADRFKMFLKVGYNVNVTSKVDINLNHFSESCRDFCFANNNPEIKIIDKNHVFSKSLFAVGTEFTLRKGIKISIEPQWQFSLNSIKYQNYLGLSTNLIFNL